MELKRAESAPTPGGDSKEKVRLLDVHVSTADLHDLVRRIQDFTQRFDDMATQIFSELGTSPGKWPPDDLLLSQKFPDPGSTAPAPEKPPDTSRG